MKLRLKTLTVFYLILIGAFKIKAQNPIEITIIPSKMYQKIEHFGASDAWACQFVGNWPSEKKNAIADLLFSQDTFQNGQPKGIGLSLWRFNVGAGSTEQGDSSGIKDEWRRAESFLDDKGQYNWDKQKGQIWFLKAAKDRQVGQFLAFTNSPPVVFTANHRAFASNGKTNIAKDKYDDFALFWSKVIQGVKVKTGITFDYISPFNEPQWKWSDGGQEGTPYTNQEMAEIVRKISNRLLKEKLRTKINIAEAGQLDYLFNDHNNAACGNQIEQFFQQKSSHYIGDLANVEKAISGHSYFTTSPLNVAIDKRTQLSHRIAAIPSLRYWMSEYCILGDNAGEIEGNKKDLGIKSALYVAQTIHTDLVHGNATAWHWWTALSCYDYKDGLVYIDKNKNDGAFQTSKILWALGHFSRFIRPQARRIDAVVKTSSNTACLVSSYLDTKKKEIITVLINSENQSLKAQLAIEGKFKIKSFRTFITSEDADLKPYIHISAKNPTIEIPPFSIITLVGKID